MRAIISLQIDIIEVDGEINSARLREEITVPAFLDVTAFGSAMMGFMVAAIEHGKSVEGLEVQAGLKEWRKTCEKGLGNLLVQP